MIAKNSSFPLEIGTRRKQGDRVKLILLLTGGVMGGGAREEGTLGVVGGQLGRTRPGERPRSSGAESS